jgi:hypothetical protein
MFKKFEEEISLYESWTIMKYSYSMNYFGMIFQDRLVMNQTFEEQMSFLKN